MNKLLLFFIASFGYFVFGHCGLLLAIPPGFASAVWPAAGLALFLYLKYQHWTVLLGVGLGSFALNFGISSTILTDFEASQLILPSLISLGAMTQILLGRLLYQFFLSGELSFDTSKKIIRFLLFVAPISSLAGSSIGTLSLFHLGYINSGDTSFTWITWLIGDTIGITLFTPLLSVLFHSKANNQRLWVSVPTLTIFATVLLFFFYSSENKKQSTTAQIEKTKNEFFLKLQADFDLSKSILNSYVSYYQASEHVTLAEFNQFSGTILKNNTSIHAVGWTEIIPHAERESLEQHYRDLGYPDWELVEIDSNGNRIRAKDRPYYYPVLYIYPFENNKRAFGLDLGFNASRLEALSNAKETNKNIATEPITLAQEEEKQKAFIVYFPVYKDQPNEIDPPVFVGYISGVFRVQSIILDTLKEAQSVGFSISVKDITDKDKPAYLFESKDIPNPSFTETSHIMEVGGRQFELSIYPNHDFQLTDKDWQSWSVLTMGVLLTSLLQALTLVLTGQTNLIKHEIEIKTKALQEAVKDAERANQAKTNFLSNMSHEIRTPLNAIIGLIRMALEKPQDQRTSQLLTDAQTASSTLLALINHTLDYNKIDAGKLEFETEPFDLTEVFSTLYAIFHTQAEEKNIQFRIELPEQLPSKVVGDALRIDQILLNLCGNAFKFTQEGKVVLEIHILKQDHKQIDVEFIMRDTGVGMSPEQQKVVFEPFKQADSSTTRKYGGTGLGLAINKQLVELMGGSISYSSNQGKGSEFRVILGFDLPEDAQWRSTQALTDRFNNTPQRQDKQDLGSDLIETEQPAADKDSDTILQDKCILLVEDVAVNQVIAKHILNGFGAKVISAENGHEAIDCFKSHERIDLILMDIQMPVMDGYEATRNIRALENGADIPIIAMTANAMASDIKTCLEAGMNAHIAKPIDPNDVRMKLVEQLKLNTDV